MLRYYGIRPQEVKSFTPRELEQMLEVLAADDVISEVPNGS